MYSYEIDNLLLQRNFRLDSYDELQQLKNSSSQLSRIKLEQVGEIYSKYSMGTRDNYNWIVWILNRK